MSQENKPLPEESVVNDQGEKDNETQKPIDGENAAPLADAADTLDDTADGSDSGGTTPSPDKPRG